MPNNFSDFFSIWKIALFGGLLAFSAIFWLNSHVGYVAKSAVLVKGNSSTSDDILAKTVAGFSDTETFVERTVRFGSLKESTVGQMTEQEQRKLIEKVRVQAGKNGGLITVFSENTDGEVAKLLAEESTETLLRMARLYLGSEKELSLIVIDQPIISKDVVGTGMYVLKTFSTAILLFVLVTTAQNLYQFLRKEKEEDLIAGKEEERDVRFVPQKLDPTFLYPEREVPLEVTDEAREHTPQPKASEVIKSEEYGQAPASSLQSVSVAMDDLPFTFETSESESVLEPSEHDTSAQKNAEAQREPTVVEYKRKLNELLAQK